MKRLVLVFLTAAGSNMFSAAVDQAASRPIILCTEDAKTIHIRQAMPKTTAIYARIGMALEWHLNESCPPSQDAIRIDFSYVTQPEFMPGALAYAHPIEGIHVVVLYDRVMELAKGYQMLPNTLLAYVLAHEIAHILEGIARHSGVGIMKASWDKRDRFHMLTADFSFSPRDVELVKGGLAARAQRLSASR